MTCLKTLAVFMLLPANCETAIPLAYMTTAVRMAVPADLLFGMALVESGITKTTHGYLPWPWTLNIDGQALYFESRSAAQARVNVLISQRRTNIDVGLMQVNWHFHRSKFESVADALDPTLNLQVGASILKTCHDELGDWWLATGCYHSPKNTRQAEQYMNRVKDAVLDNAWRKHQNR